MASVEEKIEFFCEYFADQARVIDAITVDSEIARDVGQERHQIRFYKKTLLITQMETLAGIRYAAPRYPQLNRKNKERFIQFLIASDAWPKGNLVSIPFLAEHNEKLSNGRLKDLVVEKLRMGESSSSPNIQAATIDEPFETLVALCTTEQEQKVISNNRHLELLYRYRNYLVHEGREPGSAMEVIPEDEAYYHKYIGDEKLYLAYPVKLFVLLVDRSIQYLKKYLSENGLDPYDFVTETVRW